MPERGGPTGQSGFLYQNSITALYLGRMLDPADRADFAVVIKVRAEAPTAVDDTVLTYADGHIDYIQAKETFTENWDSLWQDVIEQFRSADFNRLLDSIVLYFGEPSARLHDLRETCDRARGSTSSSEWLQRLSNTQADIAQEIATLVGAKETANAFSVFQRVSVRFASLKDIEEDFVPRWMPPSTKPTQVLFRLLRDRVGGNARSRTEFDRNGLIASLQDEDPHFSLKGVAEAELDSAIKRCTALLASYKWTLGKTGKHLERKVVDDVVAWLRSPDAAGKIGLLLDQAGTGKTVIMRDVAQQLQNQGYSVIGIKADAQLSGVKSIDEIQARLQLPEPLERVAERLAQSRLLFVLFDQVDALSQTLAHDVETLDSVLDAVARLTQIHGVRILLSCRIFDRNNDFRLKRLEAEKEFPVPELTDEEIRAALEFVNVSFDALSDATRRLLRVPLHLDLFMLTAAQGSKTPATLQELYSTLLENIALRSDSIAPTIINRRRVLRELTSYMHQHQRTTVPSGFLIDRGGDDLVRAAEWLASEGILLKTNLGWNFRHQTLFDYLYAESFVDSGNSLVAHLLGGPQGLIARSQLVQVLGYRRVRDEGGYLLELDELWRANELRYHLRHLLVRWFCSLPNPSEGELGWLNKRLSNRSERTVFLGALRRNVAWFRKLQPNISALLQDEEAADEVMWFLASVINECQREVITLVSPFADRGGTWITRLARLVSWIREWKDGTAIDLLDAILSKSSDLSFHQFNEFKEMAQLDAGRTIRVIERLLWRILRDVIAKGGGFSDVINALDNLQTDVDDAFAIVAEADPVTWLRAMLPWLEEVFDKTTWASESEHSFRYDGAAFYGSGIEGTDDSLLNSLRRALVLTARAEVDTFHGFTERLKQLRYQSAQSLLGGAYAELGESYANEALEFLLGDHRRLWLGGSAQVTRRALAGISPHLAAEQREHLEDAILAHKELKPESVEDLRKRFGYERYNLLSAIPSQLLSTRARRLLQEFQRKFPNVDLSFGPPKIRVVWESPPIPRDKAVKMRDSDWLRAIERHTSGPANSEPLRTSRALAEILKDEIKKQPDRFAALSAKLPEDADEDYVCAFIDGLAEAHVASDSVFRLIHRFRNRSEPDIRRTISWVLEKKKRIPPDLVDLLEGWVRDPSIDDEYAATSLDYLNVVRGAAFLALMNGLREDASSEKRERRWRVLEYVASDGSPALRAAALEELRYELYEERDRAWDVFEKTMRYGRDAALLGLPRLFSFLHAGIWKTFSRTLPYALALLRASDEKLQKRGAQLIAVGAVSPNALTEQELSMARELLTEIVVGPAMQRDAAADVLAHNVDTPVAEFCWQLLIKLVDDTDKNVRIAVSQVFERMVDRDLVQRSSFLYQYARSATLGEGIRSFSEFLFTHGMTAPDLALDLVEAALQNNQQGEEGKWYDGADLIRVVLRIDASTLTEELTKKRAMDTFDKLMEKYGNFADRVLAEWDRR